MISRRHLLAFAAALPLVAAAPAPVRLQMITDLGVIVLELYPDRAPITVANFLAYADKHLLDGGSFYRTVSPRNDNNPATISVIQGGLNRDDSPMPAIAHETTKVTGLLHTDGVISMARAAPGTAGSEFFIC
ncbi:peptidylprolyl isomerase, partial [Caulobacter sp. HMWF009]